MTKQQQQPRSKLLTPDEVAWRLLEEANLIGFRSKGADGLSPVQQGERFMYRPGEVDDFIRTRLQAA